MAISYTEWMRKQADEQAQEPTVPTNLTPEQRSYQRQLQFARGWQDAAAQLGRDKNYHPKLMDPRTWWRSFNLPEQVNTEWRDKHYSTAVAPENAAYEQGVAAFTTRGDRRHGADIDRVAGTAMTFIPHFRDIVGKKLYGATQADIANNYAEAYGADAAKELAAKYEVGNAGWDMLTDTAIVGSGAGSAAMSVAGKPISLLEKGLLWGPRKIISGVGSLLSKSERIAAAGEATAKAAVNGARYVATSKPGTFMGKALKWLGRNQTGIATTGFNTGTGLEAAGNIAYMNGHDTTADVLYTGAGIANNIGWLAMPGTAGNQVRAEIMAKPINQARVAGAQYRAYQNTLGNEMYHLAPGRVYDVAYETALRNPELYAETVWWKAFPGTPRPAQLTLQQAEGVARAFAKERYDAVQKVVLRDAEQAGNKAAVRVMNAIDKRVASPAAHNAAVNTMNAMGAAGAVPTVVNAVDRESALADAYKTNTALQQGSETSYNKLITSNIAEQRQQAIAAGQLDPKNVQQMQAFNYNALREQARTGVIPSDTFSSDDYKSLAPEQQKELFELYTKRHIQNQNWQDGAILGTLENIGDYVAQASAVNGLYENDPEYRKAFQSYISTASPELVVQYLGDQGGRFRGTKMAEDAKAMLIDKMGKDPNFGAGLILSAMDQKSGPYKADKALLRQVVGSISSQGVDKWMAGLSPDNYLRLCSMFLSSQEGNKALEALGEDGTKFSAAMTSAAKSAAFGQWIKDPTKTHQFAALWFKSKGWDKMAEYASNPGIFYGGLAALLLGGSFLIEALSGGDDDDDDESEPQRRAQWNPRMPQLDEDEYSGF